MVGEEGIKGVEVKWVDIGKKKSGEGDMMGNKWR